MYYLKKVLQTLNNIRTELKQSIGYTGSNGRLRKDFLPYENSEYDQEIPQSQTADNPPGTGRKSRSTITRHKEDKLSKATSSAYIRCGVNQKVLMERQDVVLSRIRYLRMVRELREEGYTDETYVHTSNAVPKCWEDSTTGLKIPFSKGILRIVELYDPWVCTILTI